MSTQIQVGDELEHLGGRWRVIRYVVTDHALFEDSSGAYILTESYLQLKSPEGFVDHLVLSTEKKPYEGPVSNIKGPEPILWRKP